MSDELKPCPFCGMKPEMQPWHGGGPDKQLISCANPDCEPCPGVTGETPAEAIAAWNRRSPVEAELREALEPFANAYSNMSNEPNWWLGLKVSDLRRAARALKPTKENEG